VLWYKAWLETRWRFLICLAVVLLPSALFLRMNILGSTYGPPALSDAYTMLFQFHLPEVAIWQLSVILLGLGGLLRERAVGSSSLTLTLPVSRAFLVGVRIGVGTVEAIVLALTPWVANFLISVAMRTPFSFPMAGVCIMLLAGGGLVFFTMAVLVSSLVEGEYTAVAAAFGMVILAGFLSRNVGWLKVLDLQPLLTGQPYFDAKTGVHVGALPWPAILISLAVAAMFAWASVGITRRREF